MASTAIHLSLQRLHAVDLTFDGTGCSAIVDRHPDSLDITANPSGHSGQSSTHDDHEDADIYEPSIRDRLAWFGFQKATKQELREIIVTAMEFDPDA